MTFLKPALVDFALSQDGAVTTDYVPLLSVLVALGLTVVGIVAGGVEDLSGDIEMQLASQEPGTSFAVEEVASLVASAEPATTVIPAEAITGVSLAANTDATTAVVTETAPTSTSGATVTTIPTGGTATLVEDPAPTREIVRISARVGRAQ